MKVAWLIPILVLLSVALIVGHDNISSLFMGDCGPGEMLIVYHKGFGNDALAQGMPCCAPVGKAEKEIICRQVSDKFPLIGTDSEDGCDSFISETLMTMDPMGRINLSVPGPGGGKLIYIDTDQDADT